MEHTKDHPAGSSPGDGSLCPGPGIHAGEWKPPSVAGKPSPEEQILEDIRQGKSHVCTYLGEVVGVFYFAPEEVDPTYDQLVEGTWREEGPYGVIHRIAVGSREQGVASRCLDWCWERCKNIRIDTHEDNLPMRRFLEKQGFRYCGVVRLENGSLRLGYQKTINTMEQKGGSHGE
ncbi:GNAT family N-acetyltransferase [Alkalibacter rhizosphaerae]|uniref:GNAT family N-acetyltransferase n=1 Tax=Alkalibacter rhizosphaerae TaxID=2815577 RepID=UPI001FF02611|nr:GNAT family N-acetyltransferase [Alkalibacter rhizosphaerae]